MPTCGLDITNRSPENSTVADTVVRIAGTIAEAHIILVGVGNVARTRGGGDRGSLLCGFWEVFLESRGYEYEYRRSDDRRRAQIAGWLVGEVR